MQSGWFHVGLFFILRKSLVPDLLLSTCCRVFIYLYHRWGTAGRLLRGWGAAGELLEDCWRLLGDYWRTAGGLLQGGGLLRDRGMDDG